jgi:hypothetical protein
VRRIGAAFLVVGVLPLALVAFIALLPVTLVASIWHTIRGGANTTPDELAEILRGASEDRHPYWDDLECVNLRETRLEAIRQEALKVAVPLTPEGRSKLIRLAEQAEAIGHVS